jgi:hypothetical protein
MVWEAEATNLDGVEKTEHATRRVVERLVPLLERLEAVHHGAIVAVGRGGDEEGDPPAERDEPLAVCPFAVWVEQAVLQLQDKRCDKHEGECVFF